MDKIQQKIIKILSSGNLDDKIHLVTLEENEWCSGLSLMDMPPNPQRAHPILLSEKKLSFPSKNKCQTREGLAQALHSFANHELQAIEMFAAALLCLPDEKAWEKQFKNHILMALRDEQRHFLLYQARIHELGYQFGDFPLNNHLWKKMPLIKNLQQFASTMSLTFEVANLDFAQEYSDFFFETGDTKTAELLKLVQQEEIIHVAYGHRALKASLEEGQDYVEIYQSLLPFGVIPAHARGNHIFDQESRLKARLPQSFIDFTKTSSKKRDLSPINAHQVNLFFEWETHSPHEVPLNWERHALMSSYEFVFFFIEKTPSILVSAFDYPQTYLRHLENLGCPKHQILPLNCGLKTNCWWGKETRNDKILSSQVAIELGLGHPSTQIITTTSEVDSACLIKSPFYSSGQGFLFIEKWPPSEKQQKWMQQQLKKGPLIKESKLERVWDISTWVDEFDQLFYHLNNNIGFTFNGGVIFHDDQQLFDAISLDRKKHEEAMKKIVARYRQLGFVGSFGIDSFYYKEKGKIHPYYLCEVNMRKTMGLFLQSLKRLLSPGEKGVWSLHEKNYEQRKLESNQIILSPPFSKRTSLFTKYRADSEDILKRR